MSRLLLSGSARATVLQLPPPMRLHAYQCTRPHRSFSASTPCNSSLVDLAVAGPTHLLNTVHALGLPWFLAIPTTSLLVRGIFFYYFTTFPSHRTTTIQSSLVPLVAAKAHQLTGQPSRMQARKKMSAKQWERHLKRTYLLDTWHLMRKTERSFGVNKYRHLGETVLNLGVLVAFTEAMRLKCASGTGLLSLLLSPFQWVVSKIDPEKFPAPEVLSADEALAQRLEEKRALSENWFADPNEIREGFAEASTLPAPTGDAMTPYFDPTLQAGGLPWWCLDLTSPDPTFILPFSLSCTIAASVLLRPKTMTAATAFETPQKNFVASLTNFQRLALCVSIVSGFAALNVPAAILLYLVPSLFIAFGQRRWLDWRYPIRAPIMPCKRPMRYRVKKEWSD